MTEEHPEAFPTFPTSLGTSDATTMTLLGHNLATELMGQVSFGELAYWLLTLERPTPQQSRLFEAVLIGLADHGFTPTAIAARLTYLSAPDAIQGALAAGHARRRLALPGRHRGHRALPGRRTRRSGGAAH